ncbi:MAG: NUDIX hydrolase [Pseudohongiellaceae bacterium]
MVWFPHITVATVVENQGRFLLVEEKADDLIVYNQPAGHLEADESLIQAAERETLEETAWEVRVTDFLGLYHYVSPVNGITYVRHCFIAEPVRLHEDRQLDQEILRAVWLAPDQVRALGPQLRSPAVWQGIEDYLLGIRYPLTILRL